MPPTFSLPVSQAATVSYHRLPADRCPYNGPLSLYTFSGAFDHFLYDTYRGRSSAWYSVDCKKAAEMSHELSTCLSPLWDLDSPAMNSIIRTVVMYATGEYVDLP